VVAVVVVVVVVVTVVSAVVGFRREDHTWAGRLSGFLTQSGIFSCRRLAMVGKIRRALEEE